MIFACYPARGKPSCRFGQVTIDELNSVFSLALWKVGEGSHHFTNFCSDYWSYHFWTNFHRFLKQTDFALEVSFGFDCPYHKRSQFGW